MLVIFHIYLKKVSYQMSHLIYQNLSEMMQCSRNMNEWSGWIPKQSDDIKVEIYMLYNSFLQKNFKIHFEIG